MDLYSIHRLSTSIPENRNPVQVGRIYKGCCCCCCYDEEVFPLTFDDIVKLPVISLLWADTLKRISNTERHTMNENAAAAI